MQLTPSDGEYCKPFLLCLTINMLLRLRRSPQTPRRQVHVVSSVYLLRTILDLIRRVAVCRTLSVHDSTVPSAMRWTFARTARLPACQAI